MATEKEVYDALVAKGFDMSQAAGIMGNIQSESNYDQEAIGDNGTSFGLVQWHVPGYPFAPGLVTGNLADDLEDQMNYIVQAAHGVPMGGTAADVAGNWAADFERCVGCQPGGPQWIARQQNADRIYQQAKTGHWPSGPGQPGGSTPPGTSAPGIFQTLESLWNLPYNVWHDATAPVSGLITATEDVARAVAGFNNALSKLEPIIDGITWFFVPSHIVRVVLFLVGVPITGAGLFALSRAGKENISVPTIGSLPGTGGTYAAAVGIFEVMVGSMFLFLAFHQLPASVTDWPSLVTYIQGNVVQLPAQPTPGPQ